MDPCVLDFSSIDPSCVAFNKPGGRYPFAWTGRLSELTLTKGPDGTITGVAVKNGGKLRKFTSRKFQNSGAYPLKTSDSGRVSFTHTVTERIYHETQADRNSMTGLAQQEDLVWFLPTNAGQIEVYGAALGLKATAGTGGTGTKLDDDSTYQYTFTGDEPAVPALLTLAGGLDAAFDLLDGLVGQ